LIYFLLKLSFLEENEIFRLKIDHVANLPRLIENDDCEIEKGEEG